MIVDEILVFGVDGGFGCLRHLAGFLLGHPAGERIGIRDLARHLLVHHVLHDLDLLMDADAAAALAHFADQGADDGGVLVAHAAGACIGFGGRLVGDALPLDAAEQRLPPLALRGQVIGVIAPVLPRRLRLFFRRVRERPCVGRVGDPVEVVPVAGAGQPRAGDRLSPCAVTAARAVIGDIRRPRGFGVCRLCVRAVELKPRGVAVFYRLRVVTPVLLRRRSRKDRRRLLQPVPYLLLCHSVPPPV